MIVGLLIISTALVTQVQAAGQSLEFRVAEKIAVIYPGARIELLSPPSIEGGAAAGAPSVSYVSESAPGTIRFTVSYDSGESRQGSVAFAAFMPARVAVRRVFPGERLTAEAFRVQDVNVSTGLAREYRGILLPVATDVATLEARQSVIEGQPLTLSAVQRVPDIRRGDAVRIRLVSGDVTLMTSGTASEPAYLEQSIRVTTLKTKKDLVGRLRSDKTVEVSL